LQKEVFMYMLENSFKKFKNDFFKNLIQNLLQKFYAKNLKLKIADFNMTNNFASLFFVQIHQFFKKYLYNIKKLQAVWNPDTSIKKRWSLLL
jgi:hypothetical protein